MEQNPTDASYDPELQGKFDRTVKDVLRNFNPYLSEGVEALRLAEIYDDEMLDTVTSVCSDLGNLSIRTKEGGLIELDEPQALHLVGKVHPGLDGARGFWQLAQRIETEMGASDQPTPLLDYIRAKRQAPGDMHLRWMAMANRIVEDAGVALDQTCSYILGTDKRTRPDDNKPEPYNLKEEAFKKDFEEMPVDERIPPKFVLQLSRYTQVEMAAASVLKEIGPAYRSWQETKRLVAGEKVLPYKDEWFTKPDLTAVSPEELATLDDQLSQAKLLYKEQVDSILPSWNQAKSYGLKDFHRALLYLKRSETDALSFKNERDCKDITILLHMLHERGETDTDSLRNTFMPIIEQEAVVRQAHDALQAKRIEAEQPPGPEPELISRTLGLIDMHWDVLADLAENHWPGSRRKEAVEAVLARISHALEVYQDADYEYKHPEARLQKIVQSLGSLVIPGTKSDFESIDSEHATARNELKALVNNENIDADMRKRATVLLNYVTAPKGFATGNHVGDLRATGELQPVGKTYYAVIFNSIDAKEWAVLVSLQPETPTILIDVTAAQECGSLAAFVEDLSIQEQQELGARIFEHAPDWDAESHTKAIFKATLGNLRQHPEKSENR